MKLRDETLRRRLGSLVILGQAMLGLTVFELAVFGLLFSGCSPSPRFVPSSKDLVEGHYATAAHMKTRDTSTPDSLIVVSYNINTGITSASPPETSAPTDGCAPPT